MHTFYRFYLKKCFFAVGAALKQMDFDSQFDSQDFFDFTNPQESM